MYDIINYVDCTLEQQREILQLRNRDDVRVWMVNPEVITESDHLQFVERLKGNKNRLYLAIYQRGMLMGTLNLTYVEEGVWERGIIANPATQGTGETEKWERQITDSLPRPRFKYLTAKVKQTNPRSLRYHEKLGYVETHRDQENIYFKKEL